MYRIFVTDHQGKIVEKTPLSGPEQAIQAWVKAYEKKVYAGKKMTLKLLEGSKVLLSHRFDFERGVYGFLECDAAEKYFSGDAEPSTRLAGRPSEEPTVAVSLRIPASLLEKIDAAAEGKKARRATFILSLLAEKFD